MNNDDIGDLIADLNEQQIKAVTAPRTNMLIFAGAGSGKTRVLVSRIIYLMNVENIYPSSIYAVTFTNKAANEMKQRIFSCCRDSNIKSMWIGTFHGLCNRFLRMYHKEANLPQNFTILDSTDQLNLVKRIMKEHVFENVMINAKTVVSYINNQKEKGLRAEINDNNNAPLTQRIIRKVYKIYEEICFANSCLDFTELLLTTYELLKNNSLIREMVNNNFREILVDEFQDTNDLQLKLLSLIKGDSCFITVVGDDDQSIYSWRGANPRNILNFNELFPNVTTIKLEQNYRSTKNILGVANSIISQNIKREAKFLWTNGEQGEPVYVYNAIDNKDESEFVVREIEKLHSKKNNSYSNYAILYRNNAISLNFENSLRNRGIPYVIVGGHKFYDRQEIKDAMAYIRILTNENDDQALIRIINVPSRKIGDKTVELLSKIAADNKCSLLSAARISIEKKLLKGSAQSGIKCFIDLIDNIKGLVNNQNLETSVTTIIKESGLEQYYHEVELKEKDIGHNRSANLQELVNSTINYKDEISNNLSGIDVLSYFIQQISLETNEEENNVDFNDSVKLMTIHGAKGLEFDTVFFVAFEDGIIPSINNDKEIDLEEERRLAYVSITRARKLCYISFARYRLIYGKMNTGLRSRFYNDIDKNCILLIANKEQVRLDPKGFDKKDTFKNTITYIKDKKDIPKYNVGDSVIHPNFGEGVIIKIDDVCSSPKAWIKFKEYGEKCVLLAFSSMKKL